MEGLFRGNDNALLQIRMGYNKFTRADFMWSPSLKELDLRHNQIKELCILNNYPSLVKLVLIGNQLETLDFNKLQLPVLELLNIGMLRIKQIITD
jgi:Leucine-rich repeat (LRR) protein